MNPTCNIKRDEPIPAERQSFEARIELKAGGCIEWVGPLNATGYGLFTFKRKQRLAHRAAYALYKGVLHPDVCVLHQCDNRACVNPEHLFLGDRGDNARDMASKGRQWVQKNPEGRPICPTELKARGQQHGMSKLTDAQVHAIRIRADRGELGKQLASELGLSTSLISQIIRGQIWRHVGGPIRNQQPKDTYHD